MKRKTWYRFHKWIAVGSGAALLVWCISGLAMVLPHLAPSVSELARPRPVGPPPDYSTVTVSPAEAVRVLEARGQQSPVRLAFIRQVGDRVAYDLRTEDGARALVDARTAEPFIIDSAAAVALARLDAGATSEVISFSRIDAPTTKYSFGELPAYTIEFAEAPDLSFTASINTGEVLRSAPVGRVRGIIERTHTFKQLDRIMPNTATFWVLALFGVLTAIAAAIGFSLAVPRRWLPVWLGGVGWGRRAPVSAPELGIRQSANATRSEDDAQPPGGC